MASRAPNGGRWPSVMVCAICADIAVLDAVRAERHRFGYTGRRGYHPILATRALGRSLHPTGRIERWIEAKERMEALTAIFNEFKPDATPDIVEDVVKEIDAVVTASKCIGWQTSNQGTREVKLAIRVALKKFGLPPTGELFDRAYDYVAEHYQAGHFRFGGY